MNRAELDQVIINTIKDLTPEIIANATGTIKNLPTVTGTIDQEGIAMALYTSAISQSVLATCEVLISLGLIKVD